MTEIEELRAALLAERERADTAERERDALAMQVDPLRYYCTKFEAERDGLRAALRYLFDVWLPEAECNGPRDCSGTQRGCRHCCPDARLEEARALFSSEVGVQPPNEPEPTHGILNGQLVPLGPVRSASGTNSPSPQVVPTADERAEANE